MADSDSDFDRVISSPKLSDLVQDCHVCASVADATSTGKMFHDPDFGGVDNIMSWFLEYFCPVHNGNDKRWDANTHDVVREVLRDNGIIPIN